MKKFLSFMLVLLTLFAGQANAQPGTICNADFVISVNGLTVQFTPTQTNTAALLRHEWGFGDNSGSTLMTPSHTYAQGGVYTIMHWVFYGSDSTGNSCSDSTAMTITLQGGTPACSVNARYSFVRDSIQPNKVYFTNLTTNGINQYRWNFGDGSVSTDPNPTHIFASSGAFNVCLTAWGASTSCADDTCSIVQVQVPTTCTVQAGYNFYRDSVQTNRVYFNNTSVNTNNQYHWTFGDGTASSEINPVHVFANSGVYTVCLVAWGTNGNCIDSTCQSVQVQVPANTCNLQAYYSYRFDSTASNTLYFQNQSAPAASTDSLFWHFGDNSPVVINQQNPSHTYAAAGTYTVCLVVKRPIPGTTQVCVREYCSTVTIVMPNLCNLVVGFNTIPDSAELRTIHFINNSTPLNPTDSIRWTFGDGTTSTDVNPTHTYATPGNYSVCLRVKKFNSTTAAPCIREWCRAVTVISPCNIMVNYTYTRDTASGVAPNTYVFHGTATPVSNSDSTYWNFGDGTPEVFNQANPVHNFANPGVYQVCYTVLRYTIAGAAPCVRSYCDTITVSVIPTCNLTAAFNWTTDSSNTGHVLFNNQSQPLNSGATARWTFGDGSSSTAWNPAHQYTQSGTYNVCLRVQLNANCVREVCHQVQVAVPAACTLQPAFQSRPDSGNIRRILFLNLTTTASPNNATATWTFGDGTTGTGWNAEHVYAQPGTYTACLTVSSSTTCSRTVCQTIVVAPSQISCDSARIWYTYRRDNYMPNKLYFYGYSYPVPTISQRWSFMKVGDTAAATVVNGFNPVHVFQDTGRYTVCLRSTLQGGCVKEYCSNVYINRNTPPVTCYLQAYPNPASYNVYFNLQLSQPQFINVYIYNAQNILVRTRLVQGFTGNNNISLNIGNLPIGFYNVRFVYGNSICHSRFQKF